ncbi:Flap endonuclease 1 [Rhodotorula toruloides]|nr:Flap endonuclease 1 [Rhodotorula toruloides]
MGVKDLGSLAKKLAPSSITTVPNWTTFAGRKIAIDASVLTNRFHFGRLRTDEIGEDVINGDHHARLWYRFIQTLQMYGVSPIVVFDGSTRLEAKAREVQRRRKVYSLIKARAKAEVDRSDRLKEMKEVWEKVGADERPVVLEQLKEAMERIERERRLKIEEEARVAAAAAAPPDLETRIAADTLASELRRLELVFEGRIAAAAETTSAPSTVPAPPPPTAPAPPAQATPTPAEDAPPPKTEIPPSPAAVTPPPPTPAPPLPISPPPSVPPVAEQPPVVSLFDHLEEGPVKALAQLHEAQVADAGAALYSRRQKSVALDQNALFGILSETDGKKPVVVEKPAAVDEEISTEEPFEASWPDLDPAGGIESGLGRLVHRSTSIAVDYKHNSFPVPAAALHKSREIIQAMGVPWLQPGPNNPFEAEGVCSALYQAGIVDCVASEDTDVVVFGAPLLRYAATTENPKNPMYVLDPIELRKQLDLSKEQLVDLAILLGTDFTVRIPRLGPVTAVTLMRRYGSIEAIVDVLAKKEYKGREFKPVEGDFEAYLETVRIAREIYLSLPSMPPTEPLATPRAPVSLFDKESSLLDDASSEVPAWYGDLDPKPAADLDEILVRFGITPGETFESMDALERYAVSQMDQPAYADDDFGEAEMQSYDGFPDEVAFEMEAQQTVAVLDELTVPSEAYVEEEAVVAELEQSAEVPDEPSVPREMDPAMDAELGALYAEIGQVAVEEPADYEETARRGRGRRRRGTLRA